MGEAREVMDRVTAAVMSQDFEGVAVRYAEDAVVVTPDQGELRGREAAVEYNRAFAVAFPDLAYEYIAKHDSGTVAIDEGYFTGTNTGPLSSPSGETIEPTGRQIRIRGCDIADVQDGVIVIHRVYFDQVEFLAQLGLLPELPF